MEHPTGDPASGSTGDPGARHRAFAEYVLPEVDVLLRVATTLTRQPVDAEDLVQDTLIRAFSACDRFDGAHPRAWVLTILRNTHLNRVRGRRPALLDDPEVHEADRVTWPGSPPPPSPEDLVVGEVFDHLVGEALDGLPEVFGSVVRLVDLDGLSYAAAARVLGVPTGTVMSRLHRGRTRIRDRLTRTGMSPPASRAHARALRAAPGAAASSGTRPSTGERMHQDTTRAPGERGRP